MKKIFLVEDDHDNADLILDAFDGLFDFNHFSSSTKAWGEIQSGKVEKPDLFLLDIGLPAMDGIELLSRIRKHSGMSDVPAIALTAHAMKEDENRFLEAGFNAYYSKPITDFDELEELIEGLME